MASCPTTPVSQMTDEDCKLASCATIPVSQMTEYDRKLFLRMQSGSEVEKVFAEYYDLTQVESCAGILEMRFKGRGNPVCLFSCGHQPAKRIVTLCAHCFGPLFMGSPVSTMISKQGNVEEHKINWTQTEYDQAVDVYNCLSLKAESDSKSKSKEETKNVVEVQAAPQSDQ